MTEKREPPDPPDGRDGAAVLSRMTDPVVALDEELRVTFCNDAAEDVFASADTDLPGTAVGELLSEPVATTFRDECEHAMEAQSSATFEIEHPTSDGRFEGRLYPSRTGLSVFFRDVSARVRERSRLETRERALQRIYEIVGDADRPFDRQVAELLSVVSDALGTEYGALSRIDADADTYVFEALSGPTGCDFEAGDVVSLGATNCERVVRSGDPLVIDDVETDAPDLADRTGNAEWGISSYLGVPVSVKGAPYGTFCFYDTEPRTESFSEWDVTLVELLGNWVSAGLESERTNARLESFAGMLAHELRNPLQIAHLYRQQAATGDEAAAEELAAALDRMAELIDVILVTAGGTDSVIDWEEVALDDAASEVWEETRADESGLVLETERTVEADPTHLRYVLENLFSNAVVHAGPDVTVRVGDLPTGFYVADDGGGIEAAERGQVFEPGYTTDGGGIGLGLTYVDQLADTYDWDCTLTESESGGARFEFTGTEPNAAD
ncbi:PAS domain-containing sensor histidine kinase [Haloarcula nitratireducens]|uniref:histidine kinase n=1 Tax=Haloarcula nitratireducens TaxID=2487749 RepID=A0AAW4P8X8_9EURY|nr:GAF domain-containing protein [Halomicroarcula nitratireducens]MBX0294374.1 GAF domain-containing protein [Halomicroarcula nitratireducens]